MNSAETAATDIPLLFSGRRPSEASSNNSVGTQDYSRKPQAVVTGGYFTISMVDALTKECGGTQGVPWLTAGVTEEQRDENLKKAVDPAVYVSVVVKRVKDTMERLKAEGNWNRDGVYSY